MPPNVIEEETTPTEIFFDRAKAIKKMFEENEIMRNKAMASSKHIFLKTKDPVDKIKERLATYKNIKKMRTDYKNYVKQHGTPSFYVPEELWRK